MAVKGNTGRLTVFAVAEANDWEAVAVADMNGERDEVELDIKPFYYRLELTRGSRQFAAAVFCLWASCYSATAGMELKLLDEGRE